MSLNIISPRKSPRCPIASQATPQTPPQWKKPQDIMRLHRLRVKKNALAARMNGIDVSPKSEPREAPTAKASIKRKNPFRRTDITISSPKKGKSTESTEKEADVENDEVLFRILGLNASEMSFSQDLSFLSSSILTEPGTSDSVCTDRRGCRSLPVDWTLRTKIKFYSRKPFPWSHTLKLCEEASGITGFVRCIDGNRETGCVGLDASPNAAFHQCSLYWQHPSLPWLDLFPRSKVGKGELGKVPLLTAYPQIKDSLHRDWSESFRALLQLLRARHCPYFYVVANSFNCVFRASGINECSQITVLVNPTTRGFRKLLAQDGVSFTMPLCKSKKRISEDFEDDDEEEEPETQTETSDWLASLGVDAEEIKKINNDEGMVTFKSETKDEDKDESLILVEGSEVHAFFNFLINCKSIVTTSGPLTGVPPTLLSPVAFTGGSLLSLKVRQSTVCMENESFHSIELRGPILPHTVHNLCNVLQESADDFSVTLANIESTKAFSNAISHACLEDGIGAVSPNKLGKGGRAFNVESLNDCGLKPKTLTSFCSENVVFFDSIKYGDGMFTCS